MNLVRTARSLVIGLTLLTPSVFASDPDASFRPVVVVDPTSDLQQEINAAASGSVILFEPGAYTVPNAFGNNRLVVDFKPLILAAKQQGTVEFNGKLVVTNLTQDDEFAVHGIDFIANGTAATGLSTHVLTVSNNRGNVWFEDCTFDGGPTPGSSSERTLISLSSSTGGDFVFTRCTMRGAQQDGTYLFGDAAVQVGGNGRYRFGECSLTGGMGANGTASSPNGWDGGAALSALPGFPKSVLLINTTLNGGAGGTAFQVTGGTGGDGGPGVRSSAPAVDLDLLLYSATIQGGVAGIGIPSGAAGPAYSGLPPVSNPGTLPLYTLDAGDPVLEGDPFSIQACGPTVPGNAFVLLEGRFGFDLNFSSTIAPIAIFPFLPGCPPVVQILGQMSAGKWSYDVAQSGQLAMGAIVLFLHTTVVEDENALQDAFFSHPTMIILYPDPSQP